MKSNTQNKKIEAITEKTLVIGIDVGSETHYARAFDYRGIEYSKKPFKFSNTEAGFVTFKEWILDLKERHETVSYTHLDVYKRQVYNASAKYISYLLTPATVCLAVPLYEQLELLKKNKVGPASIWGWTLRAA